MKKCEAQYCKKSNEKKHYYEKNYCRRLASHFSYKSSCKYLNFSNKATPLSEKIILNINKAIHRECYQFSHLFYTVYT